MWNSESSALWPQWGITFSQLLGQILKNSVYRIVYILASLLCMHRSVAQIYCFWFLHIDFETSPLYSKTLKIKQHKTDWNFLLGQASEMNCAQLHWITRIIVGIKLATNAVPFIFFPRLCRHDLFVWNFF